MSQFPKVEEDQLQLLSFTSPLGRAAGVSACAWVVCVRTHMRVVKMAAIARTLRTENALALQRSSFRENPTYFLTSVRRWVCELVFDAIYHWRSEFSHNRQTDRQTNTTTTVTLAAHARRGLIIIHKPIPASFVSHQEGKTAK